MAANNPNPYLHLAARAIAGLAPYEPGKPASELEREFGLQDIIKLASNENPAGPSPAVKSALESAIDDLARYPDGACFALRDALSTHLQVRPEQLTLGNGSNDILVLLAETFLTPRHAAIYDQYSFVVYRLAVQACGAEARIAPSNPLEHPQPLGHDLEAMRGLVDERTRLIFIANPNNPTGTWLEQVALHAFIAELPEHVIVVLDEAYLEYGRQEGDSDTRTWLDQFPNLVIVRTFSKAYGLAGLRVGYSISSVGIAELLNRVRQPFNVNAMAQQAALAALSDQDWLQQGVAENASGMRQIESGLAQLGLSYVPSRGNFVLVDFGAVEMAAECNDYLLRSGVIVRPVANYGLGQYLRITIGTAAENSRLLASLQAFAER